MPPPLHCNAVTAPVHGRVQTVTPDAAAPSQKLSAGAIRAPDGGRGCKPIVASAYLLCQDAKLAGAWQKMGIGEIREATNLTRLRGEFVRPRDGLMAGNPCREDNAQEQNARGRGQGGEEVVGKRVGDSGTDDRDHDRDAENEFRAQSHSPPPVFYE